MKALSLLLADCEGNSSVTSGFPSQRASDADLCSLDNSQTMFWTNNPGPCITNVIATCRKNFSQWESSFLWKLRYHWLKFLRRVAKTVVIQGPVPGDLERPCHSFDITVLKQYRPEATAALQIIAFSSHQTRIGTIGPGSVQRTPLISHVIIIEPVSGYVSISVRNWKQSFEKKWR